MVVGEMAVEVVARAAVGAFDVAVGLDGQENARVSVPGFMIRACAVERQVLGFDDDGFGCRVHGFSFVGWCLLYGISVWLCRATGRAVVYFGLVMLWL